MLLSIRDRLDRAGVILSGLCALHCVAGIALVALFGLGGETLFSPEFHRVGLALAVVIGGISLGLGVKRHGQIGPLLVGGCGLALMALAVAVGHGPQEVALTIAGVTLVAAAHIRNLRHAC